MGVRRAESGRRNRAVPAFPEDFLFGVGTSDHQCEAYDRTHPDDIWDAWERSSGKTARGRATDLWRRYPEDIALARDMGCRLFRFAVSWARTEPNAGKFDATTLDHYAEVVQAIRRAGMSPLVTLHHFTWPLHLETQGGLLSDAFPERFASYARAVAHRFGTEVDWWITFNEPSLLPFGFIKPWFQSEFSAPPGTPRSCASDQVDAVGSLIPNLFLAHSAARREIKALHPGARVGSNPLVLGLPESLQRWLNWSVRCSTDYERWKKKEVRKSSAVLPSRGDADIVIAAFTRTSERERSLLFSTPYAEVRAALLTLSSSQVARPEDLEGHPIAVVRGSTAVENLGLLPIRAVRVLTGDLEGAHVALLTGRASAVLSDEPLLRGIAVHEPARYRLLNTSLPPQPYAAAVALGNDDLLAIVNEVISNGRVGECVEPKIQSAEAFVTRDAAPRSILKAIRKRGYLIAAVREDIPGFAERDPSTNERVGTEVELARAIARRILPDGRVVFRPTIAQRRVSTVRDWRTWSFERVERWFTLFSTIFNFDWWHLGMAGRLPTFLCPPSCVGQQDFIGIDYYWGIPELRVDRVFRLLDSASQRYSRAPVYAPGLRRILRRYHRLMPRLPLLVVENGCVDCADGVPRARYIRDHLEQVQRARNEGIPILGYVCWSITSNREWGMRFSPESDFGLYRVELDGESLERVPTDAARMYAAVIQARDALYPRIDGEAA